MIEVFNKQVNIFGEEESIEPRPAGVVAKKFIMPPFSVLDARQGIWQERKRSWIEAGIKGELGREGGLTFNIGTKGYISDEKAELESTQTSVFDPLTCELSYTWFCPKGGQVVDPFAGGSVRGIVASALGMNYWGCDLRQEQIDANYQQSTDLKAYPAPVWVCGDSMKELDNAPDADFVFSCPPYGDLEKYSDNPDDLSNMEWHTFSAAYRRIILRCVKKMKDDSFACFVVGNFRDKRGFYRDLVGLTVQAFDDAGAGYYNELVYVSPVGSASMRVTKQFEASRKIARTHQSVLVFCKGDWRKATDKINSSQ